MGKHKIKRGIIYRNKLENCVIELFNQRKTCEEIAKSIQKTKKIAISREAVRRFLNEQISHDNTPKDTIKQA
jgi:IS30 family transposase